MIFRKISVLLVSLLLLSCSDNPSEPDDNNPDPVERSWQLLGLEGETIEAIEIDPQDESIIYVGSASDFSAGHRGSLYRSMNSGVTWDTLISTITVTDIDIHPSDSQTIYVTAGTNYLTPWGVVKTTDGGLSWTMIDTSLHLNIEEYPITLTIDPLSPETIYVGASGPHGGRLHRSINGGNTWDAIGDSDPVMRSGILSIIAKPDDANTLYVGTGDIGAICRTRDGGDSWERLDIPEVGAINDLVFNPDDYEKMYAGTWRYGFYESLDGGDIWQQDNTGLPDSTYIFVEDIEYLNNELFIASFSVESFVDSTGIHFVDSTGVYKSNCDSISWTRVGEHNFDDRVNTLAITDNGTIFVGGDGIYGYLEVDN
jgi:hypothetical protein